MTKKLYEIRRGATTEIDVPHAGDISTFIHPKSGPGTYAQVQEEITGVGLLPPPMAETASLVYAAFQGDEQELQDIRQTMKNRWLWAFTGTLYVPNKGVYIQDHPEIRNGMPFMQEVDLVAKLESNAPGVRFVPFGFKTEDMTSHELSKNAYVIALAGEEGADKLAEIADRHKVKKPYLWSFESIDEPLASVSALYSYLGGRGLLVVGGDFGGSGGGCAFGVRSRDERSE